MEYGTYREVEARIQKALIALSDEPDLAVAAAARQFFIPDSHLRERAKERKSRKQ